MSGYFEKAPLVYMSATLRTTSLPQLKAEQWVTIGQTLFRCGLPEAVECAVNELDLTGALTASATPTSANISQHLRRGYFSADRTEALIFDKMGIEWRSTTYLKYKHVTERFGLVLEAICKSEDLFRLVSIEEITLSYADIIVPFKGRKLSDYFKKGNDILPINILMDSQREDLQKIGHIELTRVVAPNEKIYMSLEQLPLIGGKVTKFLPQVLTEPFPIFGQPISEQADWDYPELSQQKYYALLVTQASILQSHQLGEFVFADNSKSLHDLVSMEFKAVINKDVCDLDWGFKEE